MDSARLLLDSLACMMIEDSLALSHSLFWRKNISLFRFQVTPEIRLTTPVPHLLNTVNTCEYCVFRVNGTNPKHVL